MGRRPTRDAREASGELVLEFEQGLSVVEPQRAPLRPDRGSPLVLTPFSVITLTMRA